MKLSNAAFLALATLVPAASCADQKSDDATDTDEKAEIVAQKDFHVYSTGDLTLDCPLGFEKLQAEAIAMDGMELVTETPEQVAYMAGPVSFTMTKDDHFAHPMIIRRDVQLDEDEKLSVDMAACGYGSEEDSDRVMERFAFLNEQFLFQQTVQVKSDVSEATVIDRDGEEAEPVGEE